jgi:hypothetical protein
MDRHPSYKNRHPRTKSGASRYRHRHVVWSPNETEHMRVLPDVLDANLLHTPAREIEQELGLQWVLVPFDREPEKPPTQTHL